MFAVVNRDEPFLTRREDHSSKAKNRASIEPCVISADIRADVSKFVKISKMHVDSA